MSRYPKGNSEGSSSPITRRDFVNGVLVGAGAALLGQRSPAAMHAQKIHSNAPSGSVWTGYGGEGEYRWSNGNTEAVREAAHGIRDHRYPDGSALPVHESYDLVIVGGGFSGVTAAYEFHKHRKPGQTCLVLENHPMPGGEAKQNEFLVDGQRLTAPQGSNGALVVKPGDDIRGRYEAYAQYYRELGLPAHYELQPLAGGAEKYRLPNDHFDPMILESRFATGYFFSSSGWSINPRYSHFSNTPWPVDVQQQLDEFTNNRRDLISGQKDPDRWLDSMSYSDLLDALGYGEAVKRYIDPLIGVGNFGVSGNAISAFGAKRLTLPGTIPSNTPNRFEDVDVVSFPGGNAVILRKMLARIFPGLWKDETDLAAVATTPMQLAAVDRPGQPLRMRLSATVVHVKHEKDPAASDAVLVTYFKEGKPFKVRAKAVVMATGGWVSRNVIDDLPPQHRAAYSQFRYGPVLTANVAVRHWRYFDKLGFTVARWFEGLGWHLCVRRNVDFGVSARGRTPPLTPDSPIVLTFYIPFLNPQVEPAAQGAAGRAQLLAASYSDFEQQLRTQLNDMFGRAGFDHRRDIAGIVLNRWGHAYFAPPPGFFFGTDGNPAPHESVRVAHGRVVLAHSELQGNMNMAHAMLEGKRGALQAMQLI